MEFSFKIDFKPIVLNSLEFIMSTRLCLSKFNGVFQKPQLKKNIKKKYFWNLLNRIFLIECIKFHRKYSNWRLISNPQIYKRIRCKYKWSWESSDALPSLINNNQHLQCANFFKYMFIFWKIIKLYLLVCCLVCLLVVELLREKSKASDQLC